MGKKTTETIPLARLKEEDVKPVTKRKAITVDVKCKKYTMLFACDFPRPKKTVRRRKPTRSKSKSKTTEEASSVQMKTPLEQAVRTLPTAKSNALSSKKPSPLNLDVLGNLNANSSLSSKNNNDTKREKRKRFPREDNDIAAENIPLESAFPALQFGINKDLCPKKRRRLQSLISPKSPSPNQFFSFKY